MKRVSMRLGGILCGLVLGGLLGGSPVRAEDAKPAAGAPQATPIRAVRTRPGFQLELLYSVPKDKEGSWVCMCTDPKGRLIVSDQYGGLYRITPPAIGSSNAIKLEKIPVPLGEAQGLLWAFDSLYVVVNSGGKVESGFYRVTDKDNNDELDTVEKIRTFPKAGEHGPHAVLLHPDGKQLSVLIGNQVPVLPDLTGSRVPKLWGEDHLLPRMPDGRGFMKGVLGPGGSIYNVSPDGKSWELQATGFRNEYDGAFNREGELFAYDADMEWDWNTPWYRPTRVLHAVSGGEFGWRNGAGKWPAYYADSLPSAVNVGPGSPTGVTFGYGAKFPAKYQSTMFISDWSYGVMYAVHLDPEGASYRGTLEEFITGAPLPLTDVVINPNDGAMYFTIGGRKTQSGLYRVTYTGSEPTTAVPAVADPRGLEARQLRRSLEKFHGEPNPAALGTAWPSLGHEDRFIRWAARVAIEHQPVETWKEKALAEQNPQASITALLALARAEGIDPSHRKETDPPLNAATGSAILTALNRLPWVNLTETQKIETCRVYAITLNRFGSPEETLRKAMLDRFEPAFPTARPELNIELANLLVFLQSPQAASKLLPVMLAARTQEEQIDYARALRMLKAGWTPAQREQYFTWFRTAVSYRGGMSFLLFLKNIKDDAVAQLTDDEKKQLQPLLASLPAEAPPAPVAPRAFVKEWTVNDLAETVQQKLKGRDFERGRALFAGVSCFGCHRFDGAGGATGPDLTGVAGRFSVKDLLESIIEPSKSVSDQYEAVSVVLNDGRTISGRIANYNGENIMLMTNMLDPANQTTIKRSDIDEMVPSKVSMMPTGLLNTCTEDEVADLVAYLLSRGNPQSPLFQK